MVASGDAIPITSLSETGYLFYLFGYTPHSAITWLTTLLPFDLPTRWDRIFL